jgi:hypothetical protein
MFPFHSDTEGSFLHLFLTGPDENFVFSQAIVSLGLFVINFGFLCHIDSSLDDGV